jgi:regulation of enolase protein 1 (concanavalin A-like superfamily)
MKNLLETPDTAVWLNEPNRWQQKQGALEVWSDPQTDFWQRTHYGFRNDNGHLYYRVLEGDFDMRVRVRYRPVHQYDQAGLMVYFSADNWLKCSVEGEADRPFRLGAVVTRDGYSDWSTQDVEQGEVDVEFQLIRTGPDFTVSTRPPGLGDWTQIRLAHLPGGAARAGLYACSPKEAGFSAIFSDWQLKTS